MISEAVSYRPRGRVHRHADGADGLGVLRLPGLPAARRAGAHFSVTVRMDPKVRAAITAIGEDAWTPIRYPRAIWDDQLGRWVSDAQVAEVDYTAFTSAKGQAITARLIVRRVKDLNPKAAAGPERTVHRLALPRRLHRLALRDAAGRRTPPRPRPGRADLRRLDRRAARPPAVGLIPRQRRLAGARRHQLQPAARRRMPWPASPAPKPAAPPCAATSSTSRRAPPATAAATSPCTCPKAGTASTNG